MSTDLVIERDLQRLPRTWDLEEICSRIAGGEALSQIALSYGKSKQALWKYLNKEDERRKQYLQALESRGIAHLEEIERITEQIVILHSGKLVALGNLHAIRAMLDKHPHRILIRCADSRALASTFIDQLPVYGVRFIDSESLEIMTKDLSEAHQLLPTLILKSGIQIYSIENPDDNLESLLAYLVGDA